MKVNYNVVGFTADQKLVDFIQKKMDKLDLFYDKVIDADVYLKLENTNAKENKIIEIKVNVPGDNFVVKKQCKTFEEAMDLSVNPIERFLKKTPDAQLAPLDLPPDVLAHNQSAVGFQFIPQINGGDGFYYAKLVKRQG